MTEPCSKEVVIADHKEEIERLKTKASDNKDQLITIRTTQISIDLDIKHIKARAETNITRFNDLEKQVLATAYDVLRVKEIVSNGLSAKVAYIETAITRLIPIIDEITKTKDHVEGFFWGSIKALVYGAVVAVVAFLIWGLVHGWKP